jgi:small subunit ribosomal protein S20
MPNTSSAKKALKVSEKKRSRNRRFLELFKESSRALEKFIETPKFDTTVAQTMLSKVYSRIDTLAKKNILHDNTAARRKSLYSKKVKTASTI